MARILVLTQNERLYLPGTVACICDRLEGSVVCVASLSPMSTHRGLLRGVVRHLLLFGVFVVVRLSSRNIVAAIRNKTTKPDRRGPFHSVESVAATYAIPYHYLSDIKGTDSLIDKYSPDVLLSLSCPVIVGKAIRERFPLGCVNVHGGPLPRYRGLMPAFWVLRNKERHTAVTVHDLGEKLDDGEILVQRDVEIMPDDTWDSLVKKTKSVACDAAVEALKAMMSQTVEWLPNPVEKSTYYGFPGWRDRKAFLATGRRFF